MIWSAKEPRQDLLSCILLLVYGDAEHRHRLQNVLHQAMYTPPRKVSQLHNVCVKVQVESTRKGYESIQMSFLTNCALKSRVFYCFSKV